MGRVKAIDLFRDTTEKRMMKERESYLESDRLRDSKKRIDSLKDSKEVNIDEFLN